MDVPALKAVFYRRKVNLTPGVDRVNVVSFEASIDTVLGKAVEKLHAGRFRFSPYLELLILKGKGSSPRVVARPTIRDKLIQIALKEILHDSLPAYIPRQLPNQVVREVLRSIEISGDCEIARADIKSFYDQISHERLSKSLAHVIRHDATLSLLVQSIKGSVVPPFHRKGDISANLVSRGVPQGLPISNYLANFYLRNLNKGMEGKGVLFHRYVDDIALITPIGQGEEALKKLKMKLRPLGLSLNQSKTHVVKKSGCFDFLGYQIQDGRAKPRQKSVEKFIRSIAALFSMLRQKKLSRRVGVEQWPDEVFADVFIEELNEKITGAISENKQYGWVFYYNESTDLRVFGQIDSVIKKMARNTDLLTNAQRKRIKSTLRTYFESRHSKSSGYIFNYELIVSNSQKADFLWRKGYKRREQVDRLLPEEVELEYGRILSMRLAGLDQDVGVVS